MTTYKGFCPTCKLEIEGPTPAQVNRNIGLHRRSKHGYQSPEYAEAKAYRAQAKLKASLPTDRLAQLAAARAKRWENYKKPTPEEQKAKRRREYGRLWRAKQRAKQQGLPVANNNASNADPCKLSECPVCGSRFYVVKGQS